MPREIARDTFQDDASSGEHRRRWSLGEKKRIVEEASRPGVNTSFVARQYGISPNLLFRWKRLLSQGGPEAARQDKQLISASDLRRLEARVRELERLLGKKTMELELLKEALEKQCHHDEG